MATTTLSIDLDAALVQIDRYSGRMADATLNGAAVKLTPSEVRALRRLTQRLARGGS